MELEGDWEYPLFIIKRISVLCKGGRSRIGFIILENLCLFVFRSPS